MAEAALWNAEYPPTKQPTPIPIRAKVNTRMPMASKICFADDAELIELTPRPIKQMAFTVISN